jgi:hypothetical protein
MICTQKNYVYKIHFWLRNALRKNKYVLLDF